MLSRLRPKPKNSTGFNSGSVKVIDVLYSMKDIKRINIWQSNLDEAVYCQFKPYQYILSQEEYVTSNNFKSFTRQKIFVLSRIILRLLMAKYTSKDPRLIKFQKNKYGKPFLSCSDLSFNLSHSKNMLAIAMANFKIGIDIEHLNINQNLSVLLDECLSGSEKAHLANLRGNQRRKQFFIYWTKKEAFLKAIGVGLNIRPKNINLINNTVKLGQSDINILKKWTIKSFKALNKNYIGHIAYKGDIFQKIEYHCCYKLLKS